MRTREMMEEGHHFYMMATCLCVAVKADLGSILLVSHVESCHVHHLR